MGELTHRRLLEGAQQWLYQVMGCNPILTEASTMGTRAFEIPDLLGFTFTKYMTHSVMVEVKASRADFLADLKKPSRQLIHSALAMGEMRWYFTAPGLIFEEAHELPDRFGVAEWDGGPIHGVQIIRQAVRVDHFGRDNERALLAKAVLRSGSSRKPKWGTKRFRTEKQAPIAKMRPCRGAPFCEGCSWPGCPVVRARTA